MPRAADPIPGLTLLGAVLAGGQSRRFGRDKTCEVVGGRAMLDRVIDGLRPQVTAIVVCGRAWHGVPCLDDRPSGRIGPLGGLNAALRHAADNGFAAVISVPADVLPLPDDLARRLGGASPGVFETQHLIGYWPVDVAEALEAFVTAGRQRAVRHFLDSVAGRRVPEPDGLVNVNRPDDLERLGLA